MVRRQFRNVRGRQAPPPGRRGRPPAPAELQKADTLAVAGGSGRRRAGALDESLSAELKAHDRERWLSILWAPAAARPALLALHAYDVEQQRIVADVREPMLAEIRLAWWREQVEALAAGKPAPAQPILRALEAHARGVDLVALTPIEEGFVPLLTEGPVVPLDLAAARGAPLFRCLLTAISGRPLTNHEAAAAAAAGTRWALARLWRGGWGHAEPRLQGLQPPAFPDPPPDALPPSLAALDALAADDWVQLQAGEPLARAASPARQWRMARAALRR